MFNLRRQGLGFSAMLILAAVLIAVSPLGALAGTDSVAPKVTSIEPPKQVLFIGNSFTYYNNNLGGKFSKLVKAADPANKKAYKWRALTLSAGRLCDFFYAIEAINDPLGKKTRISRKWDVVVLQGHSTEPIREKMAAGFKAGARHLDEVIKKNGAKTVLFMTWGYREKAAEMTRQLRDAYTSMGNELGALVVPVGLAFDRVRTEKPEINLFASDKKHPGPMGTYLAACVFHASLYGKSPEGITYTANLEAADAAYLQKAAWQTVTDYYGK